MDNSPSTQHAGDDDATFRAADSLNDVQSVKDFTDPPANADCSDGSGVGLPDVGVDVAVNGTASSSISTSSTTTSFSGNDWPSDYSCCSSEKYYEQHDIPRSWNVILRLSTLFTSFKSESI